MKNIPFKDNASVDIFIDSLKGIRTVLGRFFCFYSTLIRLLVGYNSGTCILGDCCRDAGCAIYRVRIRSGRERTCARNFVGSAVYVHIIFLVNVAVGAAVYIILNRCGYGIEIVALNKHLSIHAGVSAGRSVFDVVVVYVAGSETQAWNT